MTTWSNDDLYDPQSCTPAADTLIPIRLDLTVDGHRVDDVISWNVDEQHMTPKEFALLLCSDMNLPASAHEQIVEQMHEQIGSHHHHTSQTQAAAGGVDDFDMDMSGGNINGGGVGMNDKMYDTMTGPSVTTTTATSTATTTNIATAATEKTEALLISNNPHNPHDTLGHSSSTPHPISDHHHHHHRRPLLHIPESRHVVRLDVRIGRVVIRDQFEWDISERNNNADAFAERLCCDIGLGTEHVPTVAHAVRQQVTELVQFRHKRQSGPVLKQGDVVRTHYNSDAWQPRVECLTVEQQEKVERKEKREARLQRRNRGKADVYYHAYGTTGVDGGGGGGGGGGGAGGGGSVMDGGDGDGGAGAGAGGSGTLAGGSTGGVSGIGSNSTTKGRTSGRRRTATFRVS